MTTDSIGLIGVGLLGMALAERCLRAGLSVTGYDLCPARREALTRLGGRAVDSPLDVLAAGGPLLLSLPTSDVVAAVLAEIEHALLPGQLIVDTTTGDPMATAALGARLASHGVRYLDATVVGSSEQARAGDVLVLVGGDRVAAEACANLLACFARRWFYAGPQGAGARLKLVVNLVLGLNRAALAEGLAFARACGIDPVQALEVLTAGAAYSRVMDTKGAKMAAGDFTCQAKLSQHLKDVRLIRAEGRRVGARLPLSTVHEELLARLEAAGYGSMDNSAIVRAFDPDTPSGPITRPG